MDKRILEKGQIEKDIETKLVRLLAKYGGRCLKWSCPGHRGVPDRICLLPGGHVVFVELKRPKGGRIAPLQEFWGDELRRMGFLHYFVYNQDGLDCLNDQLQAWEEERIIKE